MHFGKIIDLKRLITVRISMLLGYSAGSYPPEETYGLLPTIGDMF